MPDGVKGTCSTYVAYFLVATNKVAKSRNLARLARKQLPKSVPMGRACTGSFSTSPLAAEESSIDTHSRDRGSNSSWITHSGSLLKNFSELKIFQDI